MKRKAIYIGAILFIVLVNFAAIAQDAQGNTGLSMINRLFEEKQAQIHEWERNANIALMMVIVVGIVSAIVAFLQKFQFNRNKVITAVLGLIVAIITVIDANVFPDHHTLRKKIAEASLILEDVKFDLAMEVKRQDRLKWRENIQKKLKEISEIEYELLASAERANIDWIPAAYAQSRQLPSWVTNPPSDNYYLYFIGDAKNGSLAVAENLSLEDAQEAAIDYLAAQIQSIEGISNNRINYEALSEFLINSAEVYRTYYNLDQSGDTYRYYTLLRLAKSFVEIDLTFFAIEKDINLGDVKKLNERLQSTTSPRKAYYNQREVTYKKLLETAKENLQPEDHETFMKARQIRKSGNPGKAAPLLEATVRKYPAFYMGWYNLGLAFDALGDSLKADKAYRKAIALEPSQSTREASVYNTYGDFLRRHQNYLEARRWFKKALEINPNHALAQNNLRVVQSLIEGGQ